VLSKLQPDATQGKRALMAVVVVFAVAGPAIIGGSRAQATHVTCGATITVDTTLDSDLVDCPNNGIVIGADDITLDLNGHMIEGDGEPFEPCPEDEICDVGLVNDGHDGITVRNGSVREFAVGVLVLRARHNRVLDVSSTTNVFFGFVVADSARSLVRDSSGSRNLAPDGDGMGVFGSHDIRIVDNSFGHNPLGLHVADSADNVIRGNLFSRNSGTGILMEGDRNQVRRNRCVRNEACIGVANGNRNVIARNRSRGDLGGIGLDKGRGNVVARNVVRGARFQGIYLGIQNPPIGGGDNVVRRNRVRGSDHDGFRVREKDDHSLLRRNIAKRNGDDGFDVGSPSTKLTSNRAVRNTDLGIEAVLGVIDGGGNRASGNGDPRQCSHILCG
jgi:large repetitive protein